MDPGRAAMIAAVESSGKGGGREDRGRHRDSRNDDRDRYRDRDRDRDRGRRGGRDFTGPRHDERHRVSKPAGRSFPAVAAGGARGSNGSDKKNDSLYMTEEQLSEKFVAEEDKFVLRQSKKKADIRVRERRARPIDFLAFHLRFVDEERDAFDDEEGDAEIEVPLPEAVLASTRRAGAAAMAELEADVRSFHTLDQMSPQNRAYWQALLALCGEARMILAQKKIQQQGGSGGGGDDTRLINPVSADIDGILRPKTLGQLEALEKSIRVKLRTDEAIDADYWEQLLRRLQVWKARAVLHKTADDAKAARVKLLQERGDTDKAEALEKYGSVRARVPQKDKGAAAAGDGDEDDVASDGADAGEGAAGLSEGPSAPPPGTERFAMVGSGSGSGQEDASASSNPAGGSGFTGINGEDFSQATKALYEREAARGVRENEEIFAAEEVVPTTSKPKWADKYRPRKPRYFNRVQMGYEWNKYNQTHYDHDNPPPKVVHGYKFNIFYPELIDRTKAPTYRIIREGGRRRGESFAPAGEEDTCLIRFSAGPPYEDIAFRIVDREWDYSSKHQRGFKSSFENGILQLHFQFKKIYYRK